MACEYFKDEFRCTNFGFCHIRPKMCVLSKVGPKVFHLLWTTLCLIYHLSWLSYDVYTQVAGDGDADSLYFTKLPKWSYALLVTISNIIDVICTIYVFCKRTDILMCQDDSKCMPWYLQMDWLFFEINNTIAVIVTIGFYSFLIPDNTPLAIEYHAINSVYVVVNFFIGAKPVRVFHGIYPAIYMVIYFLFSVIYQLGGDNPPIYSIIDWKEPAHAVYTVLAVIFVAVPLIHMIFFGLNKLKVAVCDCCENKALKTTKQNGKPDVSTIELT